MVTVLDIEAVQEQECLISVEEHVVTAQDMDSVQVKERLVSVGDACGYD